MKRFQYTLMLGAIAIIANPISAQRAPDTRAAVPERSNFVPEYPNMLREAGVGGAVRVSFVVDSTGHPDMRSFVVKESANQLFSLSVKRAVEQWKFVPARRARRAVADSLDQLVEFVPPTTEAVWMPPAIVLASEALGRGRWRLVVGWPTSRPVEQPVPESLHVSIAAAALDTLLASLPVDSAHQPRIACIALQMSGKSTQPPRAMLRALSRPTYTVVASRRCPPTFGSMVRIVTADGRPPEDNPPGEDPWAFTPLAPRAVNDSIVLIDIAMTYSTMFGTYHCYTARDRLRPQGWRAVCRAGRMGVH